jgi:epoxyqueuosine reductase
MQPSELTQSLKLEAGRLGFELSGACQAVTPAGYANFLRWIEDGYAGEMLYLDERKAAYQHPDGVMPGVKSVLMLGMNYRTADHLVPAAGNGRVARYAWGQADYHDLIHGRLKQLKKYALSLIPSASVRGVVDTAPLMEREFAQLAGLGWIGKNTLLLNKHNGSFFLLAALLIDQGLEYDSPFETDHCGTCTACLDACPTNAFLGPGKLDATKCISYLTIEHRSSVPDELRSGMQDWILGCDVCQDVCPWNTKSPRSMQPEFEPLPEHRLLQLVDLFELSDDQFRARFRKTPLWRPKRRGILRNAAIAMGNQPNETNVSALSKGIVDVEPLVRGASVWALRQHADSGILNDVLLADVTNGLKQQRKLETDLAVLAEFDAE